MGQNTQECKETLRLKRVCESCRKAGTETFLVSFTHFIVRFAIVQNRSEQTNKTKTNHNNDIKSGEILCGGMN